MKIKDEEIKEILDWLGSFGRDEKEGITRLLYSEEWQAAQNALAERFEAEDLNTGFDDIGNLFGRLEGSKYPDETILTGSHIDTVKNGGLYDGQYGIVASFLSVKHLRETYGQPLRNIEIVSLAEEEGSRFPYAFWGSKNLVGTAKFQDIESIKDFNGISFVDAMTNSGFQFKESNRKIRKDLKAFLEIHIEQGGVLEKEKKNVGVVSSIVGQKRYTIQLCGDSNHAGTTPMGYRRDTVYTASKMIKEIIDLAKTKGDPLVSTVGKIQAEPNIVNVVPGRTLFTLDTRHTDKKLLDEYTDEVIKKLNEIALEDNVGIEIDLWMNANPVPMDEKIIKLIQKQCDENGQNYKIMHSGAGHDAQIIAPFIPTGLLFVPSCNGISHSPKEFTETTDLLEGIKALSSILYELAYKE
jgi:allantoate deiminase